MTLHSDSTLPTLLVVDDSAIERTLVGGLVKNTGWQVVFAEDGKHALSQIEIASPDVVLTDLRMPHLDGLQLVKEVRRMQTPIPVILMTGYGSEEIAAEALRAGAVSYVPKEQLAKQLLTVLSDVMVTIRGQREASLGALFRSQESHFELGYERNGLTTLVNHLQHNLSELQLCDEAELMRTGMALAEALNNAIDHGNLELDTALREDVDGAYDQLRGQRTITPPYRDRRVHVIQRLTPTEAVFIIRDQGKGFDPNQLPDPTDPENLMKAGGRGMLLIRTFMDEVHFNSIGNEITMIKRRQSI